MRSTILLIGGLLAGAVPSTLSGQPAAIDIRPFVARAITPTIHLLSTPDDYHAYAIGNVLLIEQRDGFVVIDSGIDAANGRAVVTYARSLSSKPIKVVAITHWHNDHPQGISAIRDVYPRVRIICTRGTEAGMLGPESYDVGYAPSDKAEAATRARVETDKALYQKALDDPATSPDRRARIRQALQQFDDYLEDFHGTYIVPPTETFDHQLILDDPATPVRLMFLGRANTAGDLVAWLPKQKIVESGDIVVAPTPFGFGSYPAEWIKTIGKLEALGFKILIPGHGEPQRGAAYLDKLRQAIAAIRAQVTPLAKRGLSLDQVRAKIELKEAAAMFGSTDRDKAAFQSLFADPMIENAYKEATGRPIVQGDGGPVPSYVEKPPKSRAVHHLS